MNLLNQIAIKFIIPPPPLDLGGMEFGPMPTQKFDPLPTQRVPHCTILRHPFLVTDPRIFLKAHLAPVYENFEGGSAHRKIRNFLVKIFQKLPKNAFFGLFFFENLAFGAENLVKMGSL